MHKDLPSGTTHTVTVIDDLMEEMSKSKTAMDIFTKHSHHRNRNSVVLGAKVIRLHTQHEGHITECIPYGTVPKPKRRIQRTDIRAPYVPRKPQVSL